MRLLRTCACVALVVSACLLTAWSQVNSQVVGQAPAGIAVSPTVVEVPAGRASAAMEVRNNGTEPVAVQLSAFRWTQPDGEDRLIDDPAVTVSPAIATIAPGGAQTFRILLPAGPRATEASWRVILDQLPRPAARDALDVRLRLSMPVFAAADRDSAPDVQWRQEGGTLIARNRGTRRLRIAKLALDTGQPLALAPSPYLLAGTERRWPLPASALRLTGMSDKGPIDASLRALAAK